MTDNLQPVADTYSCKVLEFDDIFWQHKGVVINEPVSGIEVSVGVFSNWPMDLKHRVYICKVAISWPAQTYAQEELESLATISCGILQSLALQAHLKYYKHISILLVHETSIKYA